MISSSDGRHRAFHRWIVFLCLGFPLCPPAAPEDAFAAVDKQIIQEIREHNRLVENLEYLSDAIGPRVTGAEPLQKAVKWASDLFRGDGLDNVHLEGWNVAHSWHVALHRHELFDPSRGT